ncbi:MAG: PEP-CTERM sorting domain-containing protein [Clostridia bacterium]|nr:PEP-CTERM sorting domain-containing protein [Clostridia bacterium]
MKKTIITLMALAGVSMADTLTISNANNKASTESTLFTDVAADISILTTVNAGLNTTTDYVESSYFADTNVGDGGSFTYTLTFTPTEDLVLNDLSLDFFLSNKDGKAQRSDKSFSYALTLSSSGENAEVLYSTEKTTLDTGWTGKTDNAKVTYADSPYKTDGTINATEAKSNTLTLEFKDGIALSAGAEYKLAVSIARANNTNNGYYAGIGNITMAVVPEPATATLSLLALAGLCARRRRK